jgi:hypothetical protein
VVELPFPLGDDDRCDSVADQIRYGPRFGHEPVDTEQ